MFDEFLMLDWSAKHGLSPLHPVKDAIWIGEGAKDANAPPTARYMRSRHGAIEYVAGRALRAAQNGRRLLIGFDFAFGYPAGTATCLSPLGTWEGLLHKVSELIQDGPDNKNNRFEVAATLNSIIGANQGPFWGHPIGRAYDRLASTKASFPVVASNGVHLEEFRHVDRSLLGKGLQSVWKVCYPASVGGQTLMGLPYLQQLRGLRHQGIDVKVWPFDTGMVASQGDVPQATIVEIWPGLFPISALYSQEIRDAAQVKTVVDRCIEACKTGQMMTWFTAFNHLESEQRTQILREEGWILGHAV